MTSPVDTELALASPGIQRQFLVVFTATGNARIATRPDDPERVLQGDFGRGGALMHTIQIADEVKVENGVPLHTRLEVGVQLAAPTIDGAVQEAMSIAAEALAVLSASSRSAVSIASPLVAFEYTPGVSEYECIEWLGEIHELDPKTTASRAAFFVLMEWLFSNDGDESGDAWHVARSMEWHQSALLETIALRRFHHLWLAVEAAANPLARVMKEKSKDFAGFKALSVELGSADQFNEAHTLRTALFHVLRKSKKKVVYDDVPSTARRLLPALEDLVVASWFRIAALLPPDDLPASSTSGSPRVVVRSRLVQADISLWMTECKYPHWNGDWKVTAAPVKDGRPGVELTGKWSIENADNWKRLELGIWDPPSPSGARIVLKDKTARTEGVDSAETSG